MTPTQLALLKFAAAGTAGALVGYSISRYGVGSKHYIQGAVLGAAALMVFYGATKEKVSV